MIPCYNWPIENARAMLGTSASVAQFNQRLRRIESNMQDHTTPAIPLTREIPLSKGKVAIVDDGDYERVCQYKWYATVSRSGHGEWWYAQRKVSINGSSVTILLHRFLLNDPPKGVFVDHRNGNGLDCRRENIRLASPRDNARNAGSRSRQKGNSHGFKGIKHNHGTWMAQVRTDVGRVMSYGHLTPTDAARAYDALASEHHGAFAKLNFPEHSSGDGGKSDG